MRIGKGVALVVAACLWAAPALAAPPPFVLGPGTDFPEVAVDAHGNGFFAWTAGHGNQLYFCSVPVNQRCRDPRLIYSIATNPSLGQVGPAYPLIVGPHQLLLVTTHLLRIAFFASTDDGRSFRGPYDLGPGSTFGNEGKPVVLPGSGIIQAHSTGSIKVRFYPFGSPPSDNEADLPGNFGSTPGLVLDGSVPVVASGSGSGTSAVWRYKGGDPNNTAAWEGAPTVYGGENPTIASGPSGGFMLVSVGDRYALWHIFSPTQPHLRTQRVLPAHNTGNFTDHDIAQTPEHGTLVMVGIHNKDDLAEWGSRTGDLRVSSYGDLASGASMPISQLHMDAVDLPGNRARGQRGNYTFGFATWIQGPNAMAVPLTPFPSAGNHAKTCTIPNVSGLPSLRKVRGVTIQPARVRLVHAGCRVPRYAFHSVFSRLFTGVVDSSTPPAGSVVSRASFVGINVSAIKYHKPGCIDEPRDGKVPILIHGHLGAGTHGWDALRVVLIKANGRDHLLVRTKYARNANLRPGKVVIRWGSLPAGTFQLRFETRGSPGMPSVTASYRRCTKID